MVWVSVEAEIIADLAVVMTVSLAVTFVFVKFKQAVVLGYLGPGILIGLFTPPFSLVTRVDIRSAFAEIGVASSFCSSRSDLNFPFRNCLRLGKCVYLLVRTHTKTENHNCWFWR